MNTVTPSTLTSTSVHHRRTRKHPELKPKAGRTKRFRDPVLRVEKAIRELRYTFITHDPEELTLRARLADALELTYITQVLEWVPDEQTEWPFIVNSIARVIANEVKDKVPAPYIRFLGNRYIVVDMIHNIPRA